jgi:hypothetical protein
MTLSYDIQAILTGASPRDIVESDYQERKLYTQWLASKDPLSLNKLLGIKLRAIKREVASLNRKLLTAINNNPRLGQWPWKIQFSHTFIGPRDYVFANTRFNKQTNAQDDREVPILHQGAFTMMLYHFIDGRKTYNWDWGYGVQDSHARANVNITWAVDIIGNILEASGYVLDDEA